MEWLACLLTVFAFGGVFLPMTASNTTESQWPNVTLLMETDDGSNFTTTEVLRDNKTTGEEEGMTTYPSETTGPPLTELEDKEETKPKLVSSTTEGRENLRKEDPAAKFVTTPSSETTERSYQTTETDGISTTQEWKTSPRLEDQRISFPNDLSTAENRRQASTSVKSSTQPPPTTFHITTPITLETTAATVTAPPSVKKTITQSLKRETAVRLTTPKSAVKDSTTKLQKPAPKPSRKKSTPAESKKDTIDSIRQHSKRRKHYSKKDNGMSSLFYIPLMIQAQMMPMMIMKLKFFALKALTLGKLALIILGLNLLRNAFIGYQNDAQQYEHESIASAHYGYNGGPEYGSWVNRRMLKSDPRVMKYKETQEIGPVSDLEMEDLKINKRLHKSNTYTPDFRNPYRGYKRMVSVKKMSNTR